MTAGDFDLVVWDFDGVLNANMVDGRFIWSDGMQADLGIDPKAFSDHLFASGRMGQVVRGAEDLLDVLGAWLSAQGHDLGAEVLLAYWLEKDAMLDPHVLALVRRLTCRQAVGTNNEGHRARYIEGEMGLSQLVERVFASGRMGVAKPDPGFFHHIADWAGLAPGRILLVDDSARNIEVAQGLGWHGFHFTDATRADLPARLGL